MGETIFIKIEEDEYAKKKKRGSSSHIGVFYRKETSKWQARRRSKHEKKLMSNGSYDNEVTAAHASDTLARALIANGEKAHKLNFPNDDSEVFPEERKRYSQFIGVCYNVPMSKWRAKRHSKHKKKSVYNGYYDNEETAAHASDTLARKLIANGEQGHRLNFPNDDFEVFPEKKNFLLAVCRSVLPY